MFFTKKHETPSSTCGQQGIMNLQEHNRTLRETKISRQWLLHKTKKNTICNRTQITPQGIHLHYGFNYFKIIGPQKLLIYLFEKIGLQEITIITVFTYSKNLHHVSFVIIVASKLTLSPSSICFCCLNWLHQPRAWSPFREAYASRTPRRRSAHQGHAPVRTRSVNSHTPIPGNPFAGDHVHRHPR